MSDGALGGSAVEYHELPGNRAENPGKCGFFSNRKGRPPGVDNDESAGESRLVDLSEMTLEMISRLDDSVLAEALTRVLRENGGSAERYAAFQNNL